MAKGQNLLNKKEESHEDFMKRCFGDDFWEKSEAERFEMVIQRCLRTPPPKKGTPDDDE